MDFHYVLLRAVVSCGTPSGKIQYCLSGRVFGLILNPFENFYIDPTLLAASRLEVGI